MYFQAKMMDKITPNVDLKNIPMEQCIIDTNAGKQQS
jgi:hypothetical protein